MRTRLSVVGLIGGLLVALSGASLFAHHAFSAEFDASKPVKLKGTVAKMDWINPHSWIYLDVKASDGTVERWMIETGAPNALFRRGFKKDSLPIGVEVVVDGFQAKDGTQKANGRVVTFTDGRRLFVSSTDERDVK